MARDESGQNAYERYTVAHNELSKCSLRVTYQSRACYLSC